jgi:hypothetical protein
MKRAHRLTAAAVARLRPLLASVVKALRSFIGRLPE